MRVKPPGKVGVNSTTPVKKKVIQECVENSRPVLSSFMPTVAAANDSYSSGGDGLLQDQCPELWAWFNNNRSTFGYVLLKDKERYVPTSKQARKSAEKIIRDPRLYQRQPKVLPPSKVMYRYVNPCVQFSLSKADSVRAISFGIGEADKYIIELLTFKSQKRQGLNPVLPPIEEEAIVSSKDGSKDKVDRSVASSRNVLSEDYWYNEKDHKYYRTQPESGVSVEIDPPSTATECWGSPWGFMDEVQAQREQRQIAFRRLHFYKLRKGAVLGLTSYFDKLKPKYKGRPGFPKPEYWDIEREYVRSLRAYDELSQNLTLRHIPSEDAAMYGLLSYIEKMSTLVVDILYDECFPGLIEDNSPLLKFIGPHPSTVDSKPTVADVSRHEKNAGPRLTEQEIRAFLQREDVQPYLQEEVAKIVKSYARDSLSLVLRDKPSTAIRRSTYHAFKRDKNKGLFYDNRHLFRKRKENKERLKEIDTSRNPDAKLLTFESMSSEDLKVVKGVLGPGPYQEIFTHVCPTCNQGRLKG